MSTKHIAQNVCSSPDLSTLSTIIHTQIPHFYPHPESSILRENRVMHRVVHIIHNFRPVFRLSPLSVSGILIFVQFS
ncbi:hypothetical protein CLOSTASPAR_00932 [[Clostridium] asparagiforme DSM 15981]|uniref:Uncharacterized protein n=1 Tax=[Clostridium] asparagiforme DSM 15981 TaxID=518636 RepID=C0CVC9_9FIRM|nr:hypothetical protein CLOSTASPAR_00932 [[Clostridium] asparagiforme DSM 15981]